MPGRNKVIKTYTNSNKSYNKSRLDIIHNIITKPIEKKKLRRKPKIIVKELPARSANNVLLPDNSSLKFNDDNTFDKLMNATNYNKVSYKNGYGNNYSNSLTKSSIEIYIHSHSSLKLKKTRKRQNKVPTEILRSPILTRSLTRSFELSNTEVKMKKTLDKSVNESLYIENEIKVNIQEPTFNFTSSDMEKSVKSQCEIDDKKEQNLSNASYEHIFSDVFVPKYNNINRSHARYINPTISSTPVQPVHNQKLTDETISPISDASINRVNAKGTPKLRRFSKARQLKLACRVNDVVSENEQENMDAHNSYNGSEVSKEIPTKKSCDTVAVYKKNLNKDVSKLWLNPFVNITTHLSLVSFMRNSKISVETSATVSKEKNNAVTARSPLGDLTNKNLELYSRSSHAKCAKVDLNKVPYINITLTDVERFLNNSDSDDAKSKICSSTCANLLGDARQPVVCLTNITIEKFLDSISTSKSRNPDLEHSATSESCESLSSSNKCPGIEDINSHNITVATKKSKICCNTGANLLDDAHGAVVNLTNINTDKLLHSNTTSEISNSDLKFSATSESCESSNTSSSCPVKENKNSHNVIISTKTNDDVKFAKNILLNIRNIDINAHLNTGEFSKTTKSDDDASNSDISLEHTGVSTGKNMKQNLSDTGQVACLNDSNLNDDVLKDARQRLGPYITLRSRRVFPKDIPKRCTNRSKKSSDNINNIEHRKNTGMLSITQDNSDHFSVSSCNKQHESFNADKSDYSERRLSDMSHKSLNPINIETKDLCISGSISRDNSYYSEGGFVENSSLSTGCKVSLRFKGFNEIEIQESAKKMNAMLLVMQNGHTPRSNAPRSRSSRIIKHGIRKSLFQAANPQNPSPDLFDDLELSKVNQSVLQPTTLDLFSHEVGHSSSSIIDCSYVDSLDKNRKCPIFTLNRTKRNRISQFEQSTEVERILGEQSSLSSPILPFNFIIGTPIRVTKRRKVYYTPRKDWTAMGEANLVQVNEDKVPNVILDGYSETLNKPKASNSNEFDVATKRGSGEGPMKSKRSLLQKNTHKIRSPMNELNDLNLRVPMPEERVKDKTAQEEGNRSGKSRLSKSLKSFNQRAYSANDDEESLLKVNRPLEYEAERSSKQRASTSRTNAKNEEPAPKICPKIGEHTNRLVPNDVGKSKVPNMRTRSSQRKTSGSDVGKINSKLAVFPGSEQVGKIKLFASDPAEDNVGRTLVELIAKENTENVDKTIQETIDQERNCLSTRTSSRSKVPGMNKRGEQMISLDEAKASKTAEIGENLKSCAPVQKENIRIEKKTAQEASSARQEEQFNRLSANVTARRTSRTCNTNEGKTPTKYTNSMPKEVAETEKAVSSERLRTTQETIYLSSASTTVQRKSSRTRNTNQRKNSENNVEKNSSKSAAYSQDESINRIKPVTFNNEGEKTQSIDDETSQKISNEVNNAVLALPPMKAREKTVTPERLRPTQEKIDLSSASRTVQRKSSRTRNSNQRKKSENNAEKISSKSINRINTVALHNDSEETQSTVDTTPQKIADVVFAVPALPTMKVREKSKKNAEELVLKPGKLWRRSLLVVRNSKIGVLEADSPIRNFSKGDTIDACPVRNSNIVEKTPPRRLSVRFVPLSCQREPPSKRNTTVLENYAASCRKSFITNVLQDKSILDDFENLSLTREKTLVCLEDDPYSHQKVDVTARDVVFRKCGQTEPLPFEKCYPNSILQHCQKIGEGVYGEVFLFRRPNGGTSVMKVIPIEGDLIVNGERQKKFEEILSEITIAMELSSLRNNAKNNTNGFSELHKVICVKGKYPARLIELWELFDEARRSENDHPDVFDEDQLYVVLELANGGNDMESFVFNNAQQAYALVTQVACALAVAESSLEFEHRDLHWGNVLISHVSKRDTISFCLNGRNVTLDTHGICVAVIDFTLSRISYDGVCIYNDLALDPDLFTATGDYQFDVYRLMSKQNGNDWQHYEPYTNVLWLHYLLDKALSGVRYKNKNTKIHKTFIMELIKLKDEVLEYKSAEEFVTAHIINNNVYKEIK